MPSVEDQKTLVAQQKARNHALAIVFLNAKDGEDQKAINEVMRLTKQGARLDLQEVPLKCSRIQVNSELYVFFQACRTAGYNGKADDVKKEHRPDHQLMLAFLNARNGNDRNAIEKVEFFMELGGRLNLADFPKKCSKIALDSPLNALLLDCKMAGYNSLVKTPKSLLAVKIEQGNDPKDFAKLNFIHSRAYRSIPAKELADALRRRIDTIVKQQEINCSVNDLGILLTLLWHKQVLLLPGIVEDAAKAIKMVVERAKKHEAYNLVHGFLQLLADENILSHLSDKKIDKLPLNNHLCELGFKGDVYIQKASNKKLKALERPKKPRDFIKSLEEEIQLHFKIADEKASVVSKVALPKAVTKSTLAKPTLGSFVKIYQRLHAPIRKGSLVIGEQKAHQPAASERRSSIVDLHGKTIVNKATSIYLPNNARLSEFYKSSKKEPASEFVKPPHIRGATTGNFKVLPPSPLDEPPKVLKTNPSPYAPPKTFTNKAKFTAKLPEHGRSYTMG